MSEEIVKHQVCTITIVEPGLPNRMIRVTPANGESEKIWLDCRPGVERWAAVQQLFKRFCPRGKYVPDPAFIHQPGAKPEDLGVVITQPHEYPVVELDGAVFEVLVKEKRVHPVKADPAKQSQDTISVMQKQIEQLQSLVMAQLGANVASANAVVASAIAVPVPEKRGPGRPKKSE